jgi:crotonobetainyl-CoA:carnitine CoA-transferase CaiB-like acyl-CoA transferase
VGNDAQYRRFCEIGNRSELGTDQRFARNADRVRNREQLVELLAAMMAEFPADYWLERLEGAGIPCGPINDLEQVFRNPQVLARGLRVDVPRADAGPVPLVGSPLRFSATPVSYHRAPPRLGEHTAEVLGELLGYDAARIAAVATDKSGESS